MNKIIYTAAAGICSMILSLGITQPTAAALFSQCDNYINIHQSPYIQSTIVGYIYNDSIATILEEGQEDWIKIQSGNVIGWVSKIYFVEADESTKGYTVAKIHPEDLYVRTAPNKDANIYTTVHEGEEIQCIEYKDGWLSIVLENEFYGFIDAEYAELKTYYGTANTIEEEIIYEQQQQQPIYEESYYEEQNFVIEEYNYDYNYEQVKDIYQEQVNYNYQNYNYIEDNYTQYEEEYQQQPSYDYQQQQSYDYQQEQSYSYQQEQIYDYQQEWQDVSATTSNSTNTDIVDYANQFVGNPYVYGGNSLTNGIDCSHFVYQVLSDTGHYSGGYATSDGWASLGSSVSSLDNAVAGDVIVYPGHVAIYDGNGGLVQAQSSATGITSGRNASYNNIVAIRHFD